ncbi:MAG: hypothetical protein WCP85_12660 [Mariniphaga sp.]
MEKIILESFTEKEYSLEYDRIYEKMGAIEQEALDKEYQIKLIVISDIFDLSKIMELCSQVIILFNQRDLLESLLREDTFSCEN